ncbi:MAG: glycosyltransferase family 2 protein [Solirubrobacterales bacterium]
MGNETPRVAVVIPNWNCVADLRDCIKSLRIQNGVDLEIMVVDNGSTDGSIAFMQDERIPHIPLPRNLGFASAVNLGFSATTAEAVVTVNSDTMLEPDALAEMHSELMSNERIGGVQPRILSLIRGEDHDPDDPDALIYSLGQALTSDGRAREDGIGQPQGQRGFEAREIFGVCGAACMFRRKLVVDMGGYDERYFAFYEDVDLNVRARVAGWTFRLVPSAVVWHVGNAAWHAGFARPDAENARLVARNRIYTQVKFMPFSSLPRIAAVEVGAIFRAIGARRLMLTLAGKGAAVMHLPELVRTRRKLRKQGELRLAQAWLGESRRTTTEVLKHPLPPVGTPPPK